MLVEAEFFGYTMMGKLWDIDQELDNLNYDSNDVCLQNYIDISPPPPYSKEDLFRSQQQQQQKNVQQHDRRLSYNDVGAEMYIRVSFLFCFLEGVHSITTRTYDAQYVIHASVHKRRNFSPRPCAAEIAKTACKSHAH